MEESEKITQHVSSFWLQVMSIWVFRLFLLPHFLGSHLASREVNRGRISRLATKWRRSIDWWSDEVKRLFEWGHLTVNLEEQEMVSENKTLGFAILEVVQFLVMTKSWVSPQWSDTKWIRKEFLKAFGCKHWSGKTNWREWWEEPR